MAKNFVTKTFEIKESQVDKEARTFEGYASTWDVDQGGDKIMPGAFKKSLEEQLPKGRIKILFNHEWDKPIGMPLEMTEDAIGLKVKGKISKTRLGDEVLELMDDGAISAMSIGFQMLWDKVDYVSDENGDEIRIIKELKLREFSPVVFPMNEAAVITGVSKDEADAHRKDYAELEKAVASLQALVDKTAAPGENSEHCKDDKPRENNDPDDELKSIQSALDSLSSLFNK